MEFTWPTLLSSPLLKGIEINLAATQGDLLLPDCLRADALVVGKFLLHMHKDEPGVECGGAMISDRFVGEEVVQ